MAAATGTLYLVATPIGNLEDITLRAVRVLKEVDLIACEDTRHTLKLLNHYGIKKPLTSYFEHNKVSKGIFLINRLLEGQSVALVTDAGSPGISDPGTDIVRLAKERSIPVTVLPGACAFVSGLSLSGIPFERFVFEGFLPTNKKLRDKRMSAIKNETGCIVLYEAPHKLSKTLKELYDCLGERNIAIARELTKKHEEVLNLKLSQASATYEEEQARGEFVLVIEGKADAGKEGTDRLAGDERDKADICMEVKTYMSEGISKKEAIKKAAAGRGIPKREVYRMVEEQESKL